MYSWVPNPHKQYYNLRQYLVQDDSIPDELPCKQYNLISGTRPFKTVPVWLNTVIHRTPFVITIAVTIMIYKDNLIIDVDFLRSHMVYDRAKCYTMKKMLFLLFLLTCILLLIAAKVSGMYSSSIKTHTDMLKSLLHLVVQVLYYHHTTIISIPKNRPQMPVLPIVKRPLSLYRKNRFRMRKC